MKYQNANNLLPLSCYAKFSATGRADISISPKLRKTNL